MPLSGKATFNPNLQPVDINSECFALSVHWDTDAVNKDSKTASRSNTNKTERLPSPAGGLWPNSNQMHPQ